MSATAGNVAELFRLGRALADAGRYGESEAHFRRVLEQQPDHAGAMGFLGLNAFRRGDYKTSERWLQRALQVTPDDALLHQNLGLVQRARGDFAEALDSLDRALALRPDLPMAHVHRGLVLAQLSRQGEAADCLARAVALNPKLADARALRQAPADLRRMLGDLERARLKVLAEERRRRLAAVEARHPDADFSRAREFLALLNDERELRWADQRQRPSWMFFPGLQPRPWFEREEFDWVERLEAAAGAIREELAAVLSDPEELDPYVVNRGYLPEDWRSLADSADWSAYHLYRGGERQDEHCKRCPVTVATVETLPLVDCPGHAPEAFFSILRPGTAIPPHVGLANTKLAVHLALIIPENCSITVGGETRTWQEGRVLVFDDSFEHQAENASSHTRAVLITEIWNPQLSEVEREVVREMIDANTTLHRHWDEVGSRVQREAQGT